MACKLRTLKTRFAIHISKQSTFTLGSLNSKFSKYIVGLSSHIGTVGLRHALFVNKEKENRCEFFLYNMAAVLLELQFTSKAV